MSATVHTSASCAKRHVTYIWGPDKSVAHDFASKTLGRMARNVVYADSWITKSYYTHAKVIVFDDTYEEGFDLQRLVNLMGDKPLTMVDNKPVSVTQIIIVSQWPPERFVDGPLKDAFMGSIDCIISTTEELEREQLEKQKKVLDRKERLATGVAFPQNTSK